MMELEVKVKSFIVESDNSIRPTLTECGDTIAKWSKALLASESERERK